VGVLGGDLRPRHCRVLVVGRLFRDRVPAHGRVDGRPRHIPVSPAVPEIITQRYPKRAMPIPR
jgi:hypothetical protein